MAHYVVGDIQGCLEPLQCLLEQIDFNPQQDQLICAGDLVNRGPDSLGTLRFLHQMKDSVSIVLGNHDLHLLAIFHGIRPIKKHSSLQAIIDADEAQLYIDWLREQPLLLHLEKFNALICHAGIPPNWNLQQAKDFSLEVSHLLTSDRYTDFLTAMYGDTPDIWSDEISDELSRARVITNYFTRMRFCSAQGHLDLDNKTAPEKENNGEYLKNNRLYAPWFTFEKNIEQDIYFGHWAALLGNSPTEKGVYAMDTGCVWDYSLSAIRLEDKKIFSCDCSNQR